MTSLATAVIALAALQAGAVWSAVRALAGFDLRTVPPRLRGRLRWWLRHHRHAYAACAAAAAAAGLTQLMPFLN